MSRIPGLELRDLLAAFMIRMGFLQIVYAEDKIRKYIGTCKELD